MCGIFFFIHTVDLPVHSVLRLPACSIHKVKPPLWTECLNFKLKAAAPNLKKLCIVVNLKG